MPVIGRCLSCVAVLLCTAAVRAQQTDLTTEIAEAEWTRRFDGALFERAAKSESVRVRVAAAVAAGRIKDPAAVGFLAGRLSDPKGTVRRSAMFALGQIADAAATEPLLAALGTLDRVDLPYALEALGKLLGALGKLKVQDVTPLRERLTHKDVHVREAAALALFRAGNPDAIPALFEALSKQGLSEPRWRMAYAIWKLAAKQRSDAEEKEKPGEAAQTLELKPEWRQTLQRGLLPSRTYVERVFSALALGALGSSADLYPLLQDKDARVVVAAVRGLQKPWTEERASAVRPLLGHEDALVREVALAHLAAGKEQARPLLLEAGKAVKNDARLRLPWLVALVEAGQGQLPPLQTEEEKWRIGGLRGTPPPGVPGDLKAAWAAAEVAEREHFPRARALEIYEALLQHEDWTVRSLAVKGFGARGSKEHAKQIVAAARKAKGTQEADVRVEAAKALAALEVNDPWLLEAAAADPDAPVRVAAREALTELKAADIPPAQVRPFRLRGLDTAGVLKRARELSGARLVLETSRGPITIVLHTHQAPAHCVNIATLVEQGFYDGLSWHRVVADFVIQGGCPRGDGWGRGGELLPDEIGTNPYVRGTVGMPKSTNDDGGCQIFITHLPTPHLDGRYTVYGQVTSGLAVVDAMRVGDKILKASLILPR